jgi:hypothetical protein
LITHIVGGSYWLAASMNAELLAGGRGRTP